MKIIVRLQNISFNWFSKIMVVRRDSILVESLTLMIN